MPKSRRSRSPLAASATRACWGVACQNAQASLTARRCPHHLARAIGVRLHRRRSATGIPHPTPRATDIRKRSYATVIDQRTPSATDRRTTVDSFARARRRAGCRSDRTCQRSSFGYGLRAPQRLRVSCAAPIERDDVRVLPAAKIAAILRAASGVSYTRLLGRGIGKRSSEQDRTTLPNLPGTRH